MHTLAQGKRNGKSAVIPCTFKQRGEVSSFSFHRSDLGAWLLAPLRPAKVSTNLWLRFVGLLQSAYLVQPWVRV